jgi:uncharacterized protein (DUF488 family)
VKRTQRAPVILTIGHSNHSIARFLELLGMHAVELVLDVRSIPQSRWCPHFGRPRLTASLAAAGIGYLWLGEELGVRRADPSCYEDGRVRYERIAESDGFRRGIEIVARETARRRAALLCAEKDPLTCHRTILLAPHLSALGFELRHILATGELESAEAAHARLVREERLDADLFAPPAAILAEAYARREEKVAYRPPSRLRKR